VDKRKKIFLKSFRSAKKLQRSMLYDGITAREKQPNADQKNNFKKTQTCKEVAKINLLR
jgi:hypothetical protein